MACIILRPWRFLIRSSVSFRSWDLAPFSAESAISIPPLLPPWTWGLHASLSLSFPFWAYSFYTSPEWSPQAWADRGLLFPFSSFRRLSSLPPPPPPSPGPLPHPLLRPEALWEETRCGARAARGEARSAGPGGRSQWGARTAARAAGGRGRGSISGPRVGHAQRRSGADCEVPCGHRRSAGWREAERGRPEELGGRTAARALCSGLREQGDTAAAAAAAAGRAQGTPPLPAHCFSPSAAPQGPVRTRLRDGERGPGG